MPFNCILFIIWTNPRMIRRNDVLMRLSSPAKSLHLPESTDYRPGSATETNSCQYVWEVPLNLRSVSVMKPDGLDIFYQKYTEAYGIPILCEFFPFMEFLYLYPPVKQSISLYLSFSSYFSLSLILSLTLSLLYPLFFPSCSRYFIQMIIQIQFFFQVKKGQIIEFTLR